MPAKKRYDRLSRYIRISHGHACAIDRIAFYRTVTGKSDQTSNNVTLQALTPVIILKCKHWNKML